MDLRIRPVFLSHRGRNRGFEQRLKLSVQVGTHAHQAHAWNGERDEQGPGRRKLERAEGQDQAAMGQAHRHDFTVLEGTSDELSGRIQKRYGIAKEEAEKQVDTFRKTNRDLMSNW